ncbi:MAG: 3-isopropylmalate dehydratase large subunit [Candidatus Aminicenantes bacterium]|nr:MAG: 3-isopropylmalate dehydratase large subunit [Candidatus Aminicenantes bacterium]
MGQTLIEKIIAKASRKSAVKPGEILFVTPHRILSHDNSAAISKIFKQIGAKKVWDPNRVFIALDHAVPPPDERKALNHKIIRNFVKEQGIKHFYDCGTGICHQVLPEKGHVLPGKIILGSDSHTTTHGAFGAAGIPIGRTETASVWAIGETWLKVPGTIKIVLKGRLKKGVYAKDVILHIIGQVAADGANYKAVEFYGSIVNKMSISERMTICNLCAEMGAKAGIVPFDKTTQDWLKGRIKQRYEPLFADADASYEKVLEYDLNNLEPQVACPHKVDNVKPAKNLKKVKIDVALLGTCTNGRLDDLKIASRIISRKKIAPGVRLLVYPASQEVLREALKLGYIEKLLHAGAEVAVPSCGPCLGAYGGVLAPGENCISSANRNFKGRMGCKENTGIYLASPATVATSALAGYITAEA